MAYSDIEDAIDNYMAFYIQSPYTDAAQAGNRARIKEQVLRSIARGVYDELGGSASTLLEEIPDLPATSFTSSPVRQYVLDSTSGRGWSTYWENAIGTLSVDGSGYFKHIPNRAQDQQLFQTFNRAPRLMTHLAPFGPRVTVEASGYIENLTTSAGGVAHVGLGIFGFDPITGQWGHTHIRINRNATPDVFIRYELVLNGLTEAAGNSSTDATYLDGADMRILYENGAAGFYYKKTGAGSYSTLAEVGVGALYPTHVIVFHAHTSALGGPDPSMYIKPTLLKAEVP